MATAPAAATASTQLGSRWTARSTNARTTPVGQSAPDQQQQWWADGRRALPRCPPDMYGSVARPRVGVGAGGGRAVRPPGAVGYCGSSTGTPLIGAACGGVVVVARAARRCAGGAGSSSSPV